jgi:hypothetical protein
MKYKSHSSVLIFSGMVYPILEGRYEYDNNEGYYVVKDNYVHSYPNDVHVHYEHEWP